MDNFARYEMQVLCDQFRQLMQRDIDAPMQFDQDARQRIGEVISRAARQGSDYEVLRQDR